MDVRELEFLEGFEKRMQIVAAIDSIVNRGNRKMDIEKLFEPGQLDNIIFSVLVFIMERTLAEDEECTYHMLILLQLYPIIKDTINSSTGP